MSKPGFTTRPGVSALPAGYQQITGLAAVQGLTAPTTRGEVNAAIIRPSSGTVRWRDDGTNPDATHGMVLASTDSPLEYTGDLSAIKFIEVVATAILEVFYYQIP